MRTFASILKDVKQLSFEEKRELLEITKKYLIEEARNKMYSEHEESLDELNEGKLRFSDDIDDLKDQPMDKQKLIKNTLQIVSRLPENKIQEVKDFADYLLKKNEDDAIQKGIEDLVSKSQTYQFLEEEEDLYTLNDLKERYQ